jgi:HAD superfamily hydrolase (TIGR01450 family)
MKAYIFDMDGVIWDGDNEIPHAVKKINEIIASGKKYAFMTNNASRSRGTYVKRLGSYGINTSIEHIIVSSYAAGMYILDKTGPSKVYAMGTSELKKELESCGHEIVDNAADFVVVGLDLGTTYDKIDGGFRNVMAGAELLACAPDLTYLEAGKIRIGSGAFARMLEVATGKKLTIVGKPHTVIMEVAKKLLEVDATDCITVGDKLNTDIQAGINEGMKTALVLTGETSRAEAEESDIKPDYILEDLRDLP